MHEKMVKKVCKASGVPYDANRKRANDRGVYRRLSAVHRKNVKKLNEIARKLLEGE
jgi:hypothetical protein